MAILTGIWLQIYVSLTRSDFSNFLEWQVQLFRNLVAKY